MHWWPVHCFSPQISSISCTSNSRTNLAALCWMSFRWCPPVNRPQPGSLSLHRTGPLSLSGHLSPPLCAVENELYALKTHGQLTVRDTKLCCKTVCWPTVKASQQRHKQPLYYYQQPFTYSTYSTWSILRVSRHAGEVQDGYVKLRPWSCINTVKHRKKELED